MNNRNKAYYLFLYLIWPFSAVIVGLKHFDSAFGRRMLVAAFAFMGYTANESGDLEIYAINYYNISDNKLSKLIDLFLNLQVGKFFNDFTSILFSIFESHHIYFAFLFGFFGYFLVGAINLFRINICSRSSFPVLIGFTSFALFYSILTIFNYAFYMGGIYFLYGLSKLLIERNKKTYFLIALTPFFHIGLTPLLLVPIFYFFFKEKTIWYVLLLITTTIFSQSFLISKLEKVVIGSDTILEKKFQSYASDSGRERLVERYEQGLESGNFNYKISRNARKWANNIGIPVLLFFLFINRKMLRKDKESLDLLNSSIACLSITTLMLNVSQGERFFFISGFMILGAYVYFLQKKNYEMLKYKILLYVGLPLILLTNLLSLIMAKNYTSSDFYLSNFPVKFYELL